MRRLLISAALLSVVLLAAVGAQTSDTFLYTSQYLSTAPAALFEVDGNGTLLATLARFTGNVYPQGVHMAADNRSCRVLFYSLVGSSYQGVILGVNRQGAITTIHTGAPLFRPSAMVLDSDGDWLILDQTRTYQTQIHRLSGTLFTSVAGISMIAYGMALDPDSGQLVVRGQTRITPYQFGFFRIDPVTGAVSGFSVSSSASIYPYYGAHEMPFEAHSGAFIDAPYVLSSRTTQLVRVHPEIGMSVLPGATSLAMVADLVAAHPAAATGSGPAYFALARAGTSTASFEVLQLGADGSLLKASTIQGPAPYYRSSLTRVGSRHLAWSMVVRPNGRMLHLDVPGSAGATYAVGFSLSGVRPGPRLGDGREIPLVPDALTAISLSGGVPGILANTVGLLDANGRAGVKVDTNALGSGLKNVRVWATALVLDPGAPSGVRAIVGPTLLVLK